MLSQLIFKAFMKLMLNQEAVQKWPQSLETGTG